MSKREETIQMVNTLPEYKLEIVSAFISFLCNDESNNYIEDLRHSIKQAENGRFVTKSLDELKAMENWYGKLRVYWRRLDWVSVLGESRPKNFKKINKLLESINRNGMMSGEGKPEKLKGEFSGCYSRRIDEKNRLIYRETQNGFEIIKCRGHYENK